MTAALLLLLAAAPAEPWRAVVAKHECHRCHEVDGVAAPPLEKSCSGCHADLASAAHDAKKYAQGKQDFGPAFDRFVARCSQSYAAVPPLSGMGRFRKAWLVEFLLDPHDLRPNLRESMPRLTLTRAEAQTLAAGWKAQADAPHPAALPANVERGAQLFDANGCATCHLFGNRPSSGFAAPRGVVLGTLLPRALAPDLRFTRERMNRATVLAVLADPKKVNPKSHMPKVALSAADREALADFVLHGVPGAPFAPSEAAGRVERASGPTPTYEEVEEKVFRHVCWHCHSNPEFAFGDGGPGNTGGFGFPAAGLSLATFGEVMNGSLGPDGEARSVFRPGASGEPVLLERLRRRSEENARDLVLPLQDPLVHKPTPADAPRGMPLGLPALTPEQLSLVERWVKGGRPAPKQQSPDGSPMQIRSP